MTAGTYERTLKLYAKRLGLDKILMERDRLYNIIEEYKTKEQLRKKINDQYGYEDVEELKEELVKQ